MYTHTTCTCAYIQHIHIPTHTYMYILGAQHTCAYTHNTYMCIYTIHTYIHTHNVYMCIYAQIYTQRAEQSRASVVSFHDLTRKCCPPLCHAVSILRELVNPAPVMEARKCDCWYGAWRLPAPADSQDEDFLINSRIRLLGLTCSRANPSYGTLGGSLTLSALELPDLEMSMNLTLPL